MRINCIMFYFVSIFIFFLDFSASAKQILDNKPTSIISTRPDVQITVKSSRPVISMNDSAGIVANIKNNSPKDIFFKKMNITMIAPPELNPFSNFWWASINSPQEIAASDEINFGPKTNTERLAERWRNFYQTSNIVVRLRSGDSASAFWSGFSAQSGEENFFDSLIRASGFIPGDYLINVTALYWVDEKDASNQNRNYYTENAELKISVTSPQYVVMIGAIIGGLIAYLILPNAKSAKTGKINHFLGLLTAALLSVIVTVLLSRISETQFFIKVTVNDLWGAMAIGFLANAAGFSIINRFFPHSPNGAKDGSKPGEDKLKIGQTSPKDP